MKNKQTSSILIVILFCMFAACILAQPYLPERIASHWNADGQANGYMNKFWGVFLFPIILSVLFLLYLVIPKIDPLKANILSSKKYYDWFWIFLFGFMAYIFSLSLIWNLGYLFNFSLAIIPAIALLLFSIGSILEKIKPNWFMGIRTPWTLSNEVVWEKTHKLGGKLFKITAIISLVGLAFPAKISFVFVIFPAIIAAVIAVVYSYLEYKKITKK